MNSNNFNFWIIPFPYLRNFGHRKPYCIMQLKPNQKTHSTSLLIKLDQGGDNPTIWLLSSHTVFANNLAKNVANVSDL